MKFGTPGQLNNFRIPALKLNATELDFVEDYNYLGVKLDQLLKSDKQINQMSCKAAVKLYIFGRLRRSMSYAQALRVYNTKMLPHMEYGGILVHDTNKTLLTKLQRLQNRGLRIALYSPPRTTIERIHKDGKIIFLEERRQKQIAIHAYEMTKQDKHLAIPARETRLHDLKKLMTDAYKPSNITSYFRNDLGVSDRLIPTLDEFKVNRKKFLAPLRQ